LCSYDFRGQCSEQVKGISNAKFKKFLTLEEAQQFVEFYTTPTSSPTKTPQSSPEKNCDRQLSLSQPANLLKRFPQASTSQDEPPEEKKARNGVQSQAAASSGSRRNFSQASTSASNDFAPVASNGAANGERRNSSDMEELKKEVERLKKKHQKLEEQLVKYNEEKSRELESLKGEIGQLETRITQLSVNILNYFYLKWRKKINCYRC